MANGYPLHLPSSGVNTIEKKKKKEKKQETKCTYQGACLSGVNKIMTMSTVTVTVKAVLG